MKAIKKNSIVKLKLEVTKIKFLIDHKNPNELRSKSNFKLRLDLICNL